MMLLAAATLAMQLFTSTFKSDTTVPTSMVAKDCGGENISPELHWKNAPAGTKSFALIVHDPDAPRPGGFDHWVFYGIPASKTQLAAGESIPAKNSGTNGTGNAGYYGPCPPPGKTHHYIFTLYALDVPAIDAPKPLSAGELKARIERHVLATATLTGLYATSAP